MNESNSIGSNQIPKTLVEVIRYFTDLDVARKFFEAMRWPAGPVCPRCGSTEAQYSPKYRRWQCNRKHPLRQFTVKTGTVMEDSPLGLDKWAVSFWLECNCKNAVSSYEVHRAIKVTQKSAWFMLHRVRLAMQTGSLDKMGGGGGIVEADETFVGGLAKNMHKHKHKREKAITGTGGSGKTAVMGLLERHSAGRKKSQVRATVIPDTRRETLHEVIHKHVEPGACVYTDAWQAYRSLSPAYVHEFVDHAERYVNGAVHTNGLENFWTLFKRCVKGTHVSIEPFHLFRYVDAESFRFNNREFTDGQRFMLALSGMAGKRLTYKSLTGKLDAHPASGNDAVNASLPN